MTQINGIELIVSPASFGEAMALKGAIVSALKQNGVKVDLSSIDLSSINPGEDSNPLEMDLKGFGNVGWILEPILTVSTDPAVRKCLFDCCERAMFGKEKVDSDFFEKPENRQYYYPIMMEVIKINVMPFFGRASSLFAKLRGMTDKFLKSK